MKKIIVLILVISFFSLCSMDGENNKISDKNSTLFLSLPKDMLSVVLTFLMHNNSIKEGITYIKNLFSTDKNNYIWFTHNINFIIQLISQNFNHAQIHTALGQRDGFIEGDDDTWNVSTRSPIELNIAFLLGTPHAADWLKVWIAKNKRTFHIQENLFIVKKLTSAQLPTGRIKFFIRSGANINAMNKLGYTILDYTPCINGRILKELLTYGASINSFNRDGDTPLCTLLYFRSPSYPTTIELFLKHGADANIKTEKGIPPLFLAVGINNTNYSERFYFTYTGTSGVALLLKYNADINAGDSNGKTLLMHAVTTNHFAEFLMESGARIDSKDCKGLTALDHAKEYVTSLNVDSPQVKDVHKSIEKMIKFYDLDKQ